MKDNGAIEVVFSFDSTGSMFPCLTQVRRTVESTVNRLFNEVPNIRVGITAHGDYCDARTSYVTKHYPLSTNRAGIIDFVRNVSPTDGGDPQECYELVLHEARSFNWTHGKSKVLVMIGDDVPHSPTEHQNTKHLDWRNEIANLLEMGVAVYGVQALGRRHASPFYQEIARTTGGFHLELDQFGYIVDTLLAIAFKQAGPEKLQSFEREVISQGRMNRSMDSMFATLSGRCRADRFESSRGLVSVHPSRFQVLAVDCEQEIKNFVDEQGLNFRPGRGFYLLTKSEKVQGTKEVILRDKDTGDFYTGKKVREMLGLPVRDVDVRLRPVHLDQYDVFVQSTSYNRKLKPRTKFLYEVEDWSEE